MTFTKARRYGGLFVSAGLHAAQRHVSRLPTMPRPETILSPTRMRAFRKSGIGASGMRATLK
jgi:hypothetical protein